MEKTFAMISLGCAKNLVNSEQMLYLMSEAGYTLMPEPEGADLVIINTCGFIDAAKSEAIDNILQMAELKSKLIRKGEDEATAEYCAAWLCDNGLLDDESYAAAVTRHYAAKGYGPGRIRGELSRRGIDRELWDGALDQMPDNSGKLDKFIAARLKDPTDRDQVRKVTAALYRRGHSWEDIRAALRRFDVEPEEE